jgi:hypothetical protein
MASTTIETWSDVPKNEDWNVWKHGPVIVLEAYQGEYYSTFQVCYNQAGKSSCVMTFWEVDGATTCHRIAGNNEDWPRFWATWLGLLPADLAASMSREEADLRY